MFGTISKTGNGVFFFIAGDDGGNYYSRYDWTDSSFRNRINVGARVEFQTREWQGKPQAFAVRAEATPVAEPVAPKLSVRPPKADEHKDRRLILLQSILEEARTPTPKEQKTLFMVWLTNSQGHLLTDSYRCSNCDGHERSYRGRFEGLYVISATEPVVVLCDRCAHRFSQLYPLYKERIKPLYDTLEKLGIRPNGRGWNTVKQAVSFHRRENNRRSAKPVFKGSEKAQKRNEALVEEFSQRWGGQKTA